MTLMLDLASANRELNAMRSAFDRRDRGAGDNFPWPVSRAGRLAIERAINDLLLRNWRDHAAPVMDTLESVILGVMGNRSHITDDDIEEKLLPWLGDQLGDAILADPMFIRNLGGLTTDSFLFGHLKAAGELGGAEVLSSAFDTAARDWLVKDTSFWVGSSYHRFLRRDLARIGREVGIEQGLGRYETAREMAKQYGLAFQRHESYWPVLSSAVMARGTRGGAISQLTEEHIEYWTWWTAQDERVCALCGPLHGLTFNVQRSYDTMTSLMESATPEDAKSVAPWLGYDRTRRFTDTDGIERVGAGYYERGDQRFYVDGNLQNASWLQERGIGEGGQLHGNCRCDSLPGTVDVDQVAEIAPAVDDIPPEAIPQPRRESRYWGGWTPYQEPGTIDSFDDRRNRLMDSWVNRKIGKVNLEMRYAVAQEFGLAGEESPRVKYNITQEAIDATRKDLRRIYEATQAELRERGLSSVTLYRGVTSEHTTWSALKSWTTRKRIARKFAGEEGRIIEEEIPIERVLHCYLSPGWHNGRYGMQWEFIVMPGEDGWE